MSRRPRRYLCGHPLAASAPCRHATGDSARLNACSSHQRVWVNSRVNPSVAQDPAVTPYNAVPVCRTRRPSRRRLRSCAETGQSAASPEEQGSAVEAMGLYIQIYEYIYACIIYICIYRSIYVLITMIYISYTYTQTHTHA